MINKWADFLISMAGYNTDHTNIIKVATHIDNGNSVGSSFEENRQTVVTNIKNGKTYYTILKNKDGEWNKGAPVDIINVNGKEFIRTDRNQTESDNLGELPEF